MRGIGVPPSTIDMRVYDKSLVSGHQRHETPNHRLCGVPCSRTQALVAHTGDHKGRPYDAVAPAASAPPGAVVHPRLAGPERRGPNCAKMGGPTLPNVALAV